MKRQTMKNILKTLIEQLRGSRNFDFVSKFLDTGKGY